MKKELSPEQIKMLQEPLPPEAVKPHPTKTFLSSIKAIYVVERLNKVFGIGSWKLKTEIIDNKTAMIVVKSTLTIEDYGIELESYGGNDNGGENSKNHDTGDAYKGAVTDALTKICSYLEIGIDVFKGKQQEQNKKQQPQNTTMYNHNSISAPEKPLITNESFKKAIALVKEDASIYEKTKNKYSLTAFQDEQLYELAKQTKSNLKTA